MTRRELVRRLEWLEQNSEVPPEVLIAAMDHYRKTGELPLHDHRLSDLVVRIVEFTDMIEASVPPPPAGGDAPNGTNGAT